MSWLTGKDPDAGKYWGQEEKWVTENEIVGWHHRLNGYEFEQTLGDNVGQGAWCVAVHGVAKNQVWLSERTTTKISLCKSANTQTEYIKNE